MRCLNTVPAWSNAIMQEEFEKSCKELCDEVLSSTLYFYEKGNG